MPAPYSGSPGSLNTLHPRTQNETMMHKGPSCLPQGFHILPFTKVRSAASSIFRSAGAWSTPCERHDRPSQHEDTGSYIGDRAKNKKQKKTHGFLCGSDDRDRDVCADLAYAVDTGIDQVA